MAKRIARNMARGADKKAAGMRILVQNNQTGLYYQGADRWVQISERPREFKQVIHAIDFCVTHHLRNATIVLQFEGSAPPIQIDIRANGRP